MLLQAVKFKRKKLDTFWEDGFARVKIFGLSDVDWIIDKEGNKVGKQLYDYHLINGIPGNLATNE